MPCGHITSVYLEYGCILYLANHDVWLEMVSRNPKNGMIDEDGCLTLWISLWLWLCLIHRRLWNIDWAMFIEQRQTSSVNTAACMWRWFDLMWRWFDLRWRWFDLTWRDGSIFYGEWFDLFWWIRCICGYGSIFSGDLVTVDVPVLNSVYTNQSSIQWN